MINEALAKTLCLWAFNYLLFSTLVISFIWYLTRTRFLRSDSLRDQLWKLALSLPIIFTVIHAVWQPPSTSWNLAEHFKRGEFTSPIDSTASEVPKAIQEPPTIAFGKKFSATKKFIDDFQSFPEPLAVPVEPLISLTAPPLTVESDENHTERVATIIFPDDEQDDFAEQHQSQQMNGQEIIDEEPIIIANAADAPVPLSVVQPLNETSRIAIQPANPSAQSSSYLSIFASLLIFAVSFGVLRVVLHSILIARQFRGFKTVEAGLTKEILTDLQRRLHCSFQIELLESKRKIEPAACGVWRKKILIPANLTEQLSAQEVEALLAHEIAHLLRRDPLWAWLLQLVLCCLFWQPLNFLAVKKWRMAAELCCDSNAVAAGVDRLNLARCLTRVATWKLATNPTYGVGASTTTLGVRVERLVAAPLMGDSWKNGCRRSLRWGLLLVLFPLLLRFGPGVSWEVAAVPNESVVVNSFAPLADDTSVASIVAQPIPVEEFLPFEFETPLNNAPVAPEQTKSSISVEIQQLTTDLNYALELLSDQETDPEVLASVAAMQSKIQRLNKQAEQQELSSRELNNVPIDE